MNQPNNMNISSLIRTKGGEFVQFISTVSARVYGPFGETLCSNAEVFFNRINPSHAMKLLKTNNPFLAEFSKAHKAIVIGPYGLKGGGLCLCKSSNSPAKSTSSSLKGNKPTQQLKQLAQDQLGIGSFDSLDPLQREVQYKITENLEFLLSGSQKGIIEDIVHSLNALKEVSLMGHAVPLSSAIILLKCLGEEGIWEQSSWGEVRREIANMARKLLFLAYHKSGDKVHFFQNNQGELSGIASGIKNRILEEESNFPENGLLCDVKAINSVINLMKTDERWYVSLCVNGRNLIQLVATKDVELGIEILKGIITNIRDTLQFNLSANYLTLDYLRELSKVDPGAYDLLFSLLQTHRESKWELLYIILDEIEKVILNPEVKHDVKTAFLDGDKKQNYVGFLDFAAFNAYWVSDRLWGNNWRIREKLAVSLVKLAEIDNSSIKKRVNDVIADRLVLETDRRVREVLMNPTSIQKAKSILEATWDRRKDRYERALDEQKVILLELESKLHLSHGKKRDKILEGFKEQKKCMEAQIAEISELGAKFGKELTFLEKYEFSNKEIKEKVDSLVVETSELWGKFDRKFSTIMRKLDSGQTIGNIGNLCKIPPNNSMFIGRDTEIRAIHAMIPPRKKRTVTQIAIVGMGGVGKSQLAIEFATRYQEEFGLIWWIDAVGKAQIEASFMEIGESLNILNSESRQDEITRQIILTLTREPTPWLLVFDNALNQKLISEYIPSGQGVALITSINPNWDSIYQLSPFSRENSIKLLQNYTNNKDRRNADLIADELGDLPLALSQAGAFMKQTRTSYEEYLNIYRDQNQAMLELENEGESADATWHINLTQIGQQNQDALSWIEGIAHLGPNFISKEFAKELFIKISGKKDVLKYKQALGLITAYSLLELDENGNVMMHKIIQGVVRKKYKLTSKVMKGLESAFKEIFNYNAENYEKLEFYRKTAPHLRCYLKFTTLKTPDTSELFNLIGLFSLEVEQNAKIAQDFLHQALKLKGELFGKNSIEAAKVYNNLGNAYFEENDLTQAIQNYKKALDLKIKLLGAGKLEVAYSYNNLGLAYSEKKDLSEAVKCITKAYEIMKSNLGDDHVDVTTPCVNLGVAYDELKNYPLATKYLNQALEIRKEKLGDDHPDVADCLLNIGVLEKHKGNLAVARQTIVKASKILTDIYGREHPYAKNARDQLALLNRN